jgi:hypothetical protein
VLPVRAISEFQAVSFVIGFSAFFPIALRWGRLRRKPQASRSQKVIHRVTAKLSTGNVDTAGPSRRLRHSLLVGLVHK